MTEKKIATFIRQLYRDTDKVNAKLFHVDPPMLDYDEHSATSYVVVSASSVFDLDRPETYIFAANEDGEITCWLELPGSFQGDLDHVAALRDAGYEVRASW